MPIATIRPSPLVAKAGSRKAGFVLGSNWQRPESSTPLNVEADPLHPVKPLENAPAVLQGIISHFVDPQLRPKLRESSDHFRLIEDLGLDSLDMMEVMLRVEDLLKIHVSDEELRHFRTLGEVRQFIDRTARARSAPGAVPLPAS